MDDAIIERKNKNENGNEKSNNNNYNRKSIDLKSIRVRTPIKNCVINWIKSNFEADDYIDKDRKKSHNASTNPAVNVKRSGSVSELKNFNSEKKRNESLSNSPMKKNKNFNLFRTSFFNLPLISCLSGGKNK